MGTWTWKHSSLFLLYPAVSVHPSSQLAEDCPSATTQHFSQVWSSVALVALEEQKCHQTKCLWSLSDFTQRIVSKALCTELTGVVYLLWLCAVPKLQKCFWNTAGNSSDGWACSLGHPSHNHPGCEMALQEPAPMFPSAEQHIHSLDKQLVRSWGFIMYSSKYVSMTSAVPLGWQAWSPSGWHCQEQTGLLQAAPWGHGFCELRGAAIPQGNMGNHHSKVQHDLWCHWARETKARLVWQTFFFMQLPRSLRCDFFFPAVLVADACGWILNRRV